MRRDANSLKRVAVVGGVVFAIGIAITAIQLIPSLELYGQSSRFAGGPLQATGKTPRSVRETVVATFGLASFVFPNLVGRMKNSMMVSGTLWGGEAHWQGFIGVVPCFLAILAAWAGVDRRRLPYAALGLSVPILVLYTPLGPVLYERFFLLYIFCASVLAAFGCTAACSDELIAPRARLAVRAIAGFIAATVATLIAINIALASAGDRIRAFVDAQVSATLATNYFGQSYPALYIQKAHQFLDDLRLISPHTAVPILIAVAGLITISARTQRRLGASWFAKIGVTLTVVDMVFMTVTHVPFVDLPRYPFTPSSPAIDRVRNDVGMYRVISYRSPSGPPVMPLGLVSIYGIEAADGNDDLGPPNLFQLISFAHKPCGDELCVEPRNINLAGVRYSSHRLRRATSRRPLRTGVRPRNACVSGPGRRWTRVLVDVVRSRPGHGGRCGESEICGVQPSCNRRPRQTSSVCLRRRERRVADGRPRAHSAEGRDPGGCKDGRAPRIE